MFQVLCFYLSDGLVSLSANGTNLTVKMILKAAPSLFQIGIDAFEL